MSARRAAVPAYAKLNLTLKVLHKRPDNFHELRTVFQTISLHDTLEIEFRKSRRRGITVESSVEIPNNIVLRAAALLLDEMKIQAEVRFHLTKRIPLGGGLGGGSTNAAAVLLALPALAGRKVDPARLHQLAAQLGSDVPFFLCGGTALGLSRGEELYPFPEPKTSYGLLVTPGIHVSTPEAYTALGRTSAVPPMDGFHSHTWNLPLRATAGQWGPFCQNDFEEAVFARHPSLKAAKLKLYRQGAQLAMMSGSGSSIFGFFRSADAARHVRRLWPPSTAHLFHTVSRVKYQQAWRKCLSR